MRLMYLGSCLAAALVAFQAPGVAYAQSQGEPAASTWYDSYGRSSVDRAVALEAARLQAQARDGGFGPAQNNTTVQGDVLNYTTNNGPVSTSTAYNSVNSSSTTTSASGTGITISVETGQTSGTTTQTAVSGVRTGTATSTVTCGGAGSCD